MGIAESTSKGRRNFYVKGTKPAACFFVVVLGVCFFFLSVFFFFNKAFCGMNQVIQSGRITSAGCGTAHGAVETA